MNLRRRKERQLMAKASEVVQRGVQELNAKLKEIKQADEDDLGKLSQSFDEIGTRADEIAEVLNRADQALSGTDEDDEEADDDQAEDEDGEEADGDAEEQQPQQSKRGR